MKYPICLLLSLNSLMLFGQQFDTATPESVNISGTRMERVDNYIKSAIETNVIPGGVFILAREGKIVYHKSFGNRDGNTAYKNQDIFRIASMTKAITSIAILQLYEQGLLGLDDPLEWFIPAFKEMKVLDTFNQQDSSYTTEPAENKITIRHLLTHTSGITYGDFNPGKVMAVYSKFDMLGQGLSNPKWTTEEFINRLAEVPLVFEPGTRYLYGLNMDVLGRVIEVVSGETLSEYFQRHIFEPIGMEDTYFYLTADKHSRLVPIYQQSDDGTYAPVSDDALVGFINYPIAEDKNHYAGGGGLSSTAIDYAKFIQMLLNDGSFNGNRLLNPQTIDLINTDQMITLNKTGNGFSDIPGVTFGLGFMVYTDDARGLNIKSPGTYEWGGYFNTKYFIDPEEELIFVGMTQISGFKYGYFWDRLYALLYGVLED
ncbi:MAG: serine hydrolase [Cyclobacteriaceae bacterium]|nr:MAG: serine hydrolase [Cyclobacteriaceae bacterium]